MRSRKLADRRLHDPLTVIARCARDWFTANIDTAAPDNPFLPSLLAQLFKSLFGSGRCLICHSISQKRKKPQRQRLAWQLPSRLRRSTLTSDKSSESAVLAGGRTLPVRRGLKRRRAILGRTFPVDRKVARHRNHFVVIAERDRPRA